jgi:uncharacterized protein (TIGR02271 family)
VSGRPTWASVKTGLFGLKESLLPLQDADLQGDTVTVPFEKSQVKDAPNVDISHDEPLTQDEVDLLYRHYNISWDDSAQAYQTGAEHARSADFTGAGTGTAGSGRADYDTDRTDYDTERTGVNRGDDAMTRSEERLNVGTQQEQVGKARLRKYVVTEQQQVNVPVSREEVRLEREPVTEANRGDAFDGPDITESEHEVTLRAERPVVDTETVPVERVRLGKETVTEEQTVGGEVRKERIEADLPDEGRRNLD